MVGRNIALIFMTLLVLTGCSGRSDKKPTSNCTGDPAYLQNSSCQRLRWDSLPVVMTFDDNIPAPVRRQAMQAAAEWEAAAGKPLFLFDTLEGRSPKDLNMITIVADSQWDGASNENAKTFYLYERQSLRQTIISIRNRVIENENIDTFSVILHELGHVLGLGHDETNHSSIMYPQLGEYESARTLDPIDIERVRTF